MTDGTDAELTIDELARRVGMTVRNVRAHQSREILPPPQIRGRTGYYGPEHVARLELVKDLQAEGFNLEAIRRIIERSGQGPVDQVLEFTRAVAVPFTEEEPEVVDGTTLAERFGDALNADVVRKLAKLGLLRSIGGGRFEVVSPALDRISGDVLALGIPLEAGVEVLEEVRRHIDAVAKAYVGLFLDHVWRPFEERGEPEADWPEVRAALDRIRPLAAEVTIAMFGIVMTGRTGKALERELARMSGGSGPEKPGRRRRR